MSGSSCAAGFVGKSRCAAPQLATLAILLGVGGFAVAFGGGGDPVPGPDSPALFGVALGLHPDVDPEFPPDLGRVADLGARAVLLPVDVWQDGLQSDEIGVASATPTDRALAAIIRDAHRRGLATALMPIVNLRGGPPEDWRGRLRPDDPERWWASYRGLLVRYARLAAREDVAVLVVGSELTSLQGEGARWRSVAAAVRAEYGGKLAYVANHDALDAPAPLEFVDLAGVSAYFPLTDDPDASEAELRTAWERLSLVLADFAARAARPLVVFEVGYPSLDGAAIRPWDYTRGTPVDLEEQRRAYAAAAAGLQRLRPAGAFFWTWLGAGGRFDRHYTPRGKPAEAVLRSYLRSRAAP